MLLALHVKVQRRKHNGRRSGSGQHTMGELPDIP
jgi:hypothetical protein